jgi:putative lipoprotein
MVHPRRATISAVRSLFVLFIVASQIVAAQIPGRAGEQESVAGTSWQLVRFQNANGATLTPDVRSKYTITFGTDGRVSVRLDCNRGSSTWSSAGANNLTFGRLTTTTFIGCASGSLAPTIARDWSYVRSYAIRNGHLFLGLADGGTYEFEPINVFSDAPGTVLSGEASSVRGTATYRERIALPRQAVFEATLEDVTRGVVPSEVIARVRNEQPGNAPIDFTISYDIARINQTHTYAVRAQILVNDQVWFTSDRNSPVLTRGNPSAVQLVLRRASGPTLPGRVQSPGTLENTNWRLIELGNAPVLIDARHPEANITLQSGNRRVTGSTGCNRLSGSYSVNGSRLSFGTIASTKMACISGMEIEQPFLNALGRVRSWRISGQTLELLDDRGNSLARFDAV